MSSVPTELVDRVRTRLLDGGGRDPGLTSTRVAVALRAEGRLLGDDDVAALTRTLRAEMTGSGVLDPLLQLPGVTDVLVNGPDEVWLDRGHGLERADVRFGDEAAVRRLAQRLAAAGGRRLDDAEPTVDLRLPDGVRLHAVLPPLAVGGTCISLRVPPRRALTLADWDAGGASCPPLSAVLRRLVAARSSFLVTGGTGTGKTTLLATLLGLVEPRERIVVVEESSELRPDHPHVVRLEARQGNVEGAGAVGVRQLVRQALRMRPDRLVLGEVRGGEVVDLLAALNTGHDGGGGTVHANAPHALPARVEALAATAGLPRDAAHSQLVAAVDVVVHLDRAHGRRRVAGVWALHRTSAGAAVCVPAWDGGGVAGPAAGQLTARWAGSG